MRCAIILSILLLGARCVPAGAADSAACRDPLLRRATIGADGIRGAVVSGQKPLQNAAVRLYSSGSLIWTGATHEDGTFEIPIHTLTFTLPCAFARAFFCPSADTADTFLETVPATYKLVVAGWGSVEVTVDPRLDREQFQRAQWSLLLLDGPCVGTFMSIG